ncbi:calumenin-like isoform X2 [Watersipora subatra]|uniref:calumenin-like isoform X2 n=1 Tax=Watersipora subatra TaxID=2589382 RepID=UPI00355ADEC3
MLVCSGMLKKSLYGVGVILALLALTTSGSIIPDNHDKRTQERELSDADHSLNGHNAEYDHEAFLGREKAREFDHFSPEQSIQGLKVIVDKIDSNNDKKVTESELVAWIKYIQRRYITQNAKVQWNNYELKPDDSMSWEHYFNNTYAGISDEELNGMQSGGAFSHKEMKDRDYRRFKLADVDYDGLLVFEEYVNFLHPEDALHMREVVVQEALEDLDKNHNGVVSMDEYLSDMWPQLGKEEEPDWMAEEREHFSKWRDLNKDGVLDAVEIQHWVMPDDYDHAIAEAKHLIYEADSDKDGSLTKEEIVDNHDLFVGSQATDFGEAFKYDHDEF